MLRFFPLTLGWKTYQCKVPRGRSTCASTLGIYGNGDAPRDEDEKRLQRMCSDLTSLNVALPDLHSGVCGGFTRLAEDSGLSLIR